VYTFGREVLPALIAGRTVVRNSFSIYLIDIASPYLDFLTRFLMVTFLPPIVGRSPLAILLRLALRVLPNLLSARLAPAAIVAHSLHRNIVTKTVCKVIIAHNHTTNDGASEFLAK